MVSDLATFAWLSDVFVLSEQAGHGLDSVMVRTIVEHPAVAGTQLQVLATRDAHGLYEKVGYNAMQQPAWRMARSVRRADE